MNQACYFAFLNPGDTVLAMDLSHGGHLTHGAPVSHMGKVFNFMRYKITAPQAGGRDRLRRTDGYREKLPGQSSCCAAIPRIRVTADYAAFKKVADEVGALTMADISHIGGLVAAERPSPQSVPIPVSMSSPPRPARRCTFRAAG